MLDKNISSLEDFLKTILIDKVSLHYNTNNYVYGNYISDIITQYLIYNELKDSNLFNVYDINIIRQNSNLSIINLKNVSSNFELVYIEINLNNNYFKIHFTEYYKYLITTKNLNFIYSDLIRQSSSHYKYILDSLKNKYNFYFNLELEVLYLVLNIFNTNNITDEKILFEYVSNNLNIQNLRNNLYEDYFLAHSYYFNSICGKYVNNNIKDNIYLLEYILKFIYLNNKSLDKNKFKNILIYTTLLEEGLKYINYDFEKINNYLSSLNINKYLKPKLYTLNLKGLSIKYFYSLICKSYIHGYFYIRSFFITLFDLEYVLKEHNLNKSNIFKCNLNEQIDRYKIILKVIEKEKRVDYVSNEFIYGLLSNEEVNYDVSLSFESWLNNFIINYKKEYIDVIIEPLAITERRLGVYIVELCNLALLMEEGKYNRHCVGGYGDSLKPYYRIFSLRLKDWRFTSSFRYWENKKSWVLEECQGYDKKTNSKVYLTSLKDTKLKTKIKFIIEELISELNILYNPSNKLKDDIINKGVF